MYITLSLHVPILFCMVAVCQPLLGLLFYLILIVCFFDYVCQADSFHSHPSYCLTAHQISLALCNSTTPFAADGDRPHPLRPEIFRILSALACYILNDPFCCVTLLGIIKLSLLQRRLPMLFE